MPFSFFEAVAGWCFPIDSSEAGEVELGRAAADEFIDALRAGHLPADALAQIAEAPQNGTYAEWSFYVRLQEHLEARLFS
jgi:hypothetical protein